MNITTINETVVYTVTTDKDENHIYHRYGSEVWMVGPNGVEMVYDCTELENKFQEYINYAITTSNMDNTFIDKCAKAIFLVGNHKDIPYGNFPYEWEKQPLTVKIDYIKKAKAVLNVINNGDMCGN